MFKNGQTGITNQAENVRVRTENTDTPIKKKLKSKPMVGNE
jgi:hypothetical protein